MNSHVNTFFLHYLHSAHILFSKLRLQSWNVFFVLFFVLPVLVQWDVCRSPRLVRQQPHRLSSVFNLHLICRSFILFPENGRGKKSTRGESVKSRMTRRVPECESWSQGAKLTQALQELVDSTGLRLRVGVQVVGHSHLEQTWKHRNRDSRQRLTRMIHCSAIESR